MAHEDLPKAYNPQDVEDKLYQAWEESGYFNPDNLPGDRTEPFCISFPPPNVTGVLHLGHALENSIMDIQIRYHRLRGKKAVLIPGTDHAAVATQAKVEKLLIEQEGISNPREELGREELLNRIRTFAENSKSTIINQVKKMGSSCDWSRLAYTFDDHRSRVVNEVFKRMFEDELIYRGYRVVNWSVKGQSTCSDDELEYEESTTSLYTFKYSADFPIAISTTRPETKLGDTAVAVNPNDERYKEYIGQIFTVEVGAAKPLEIKIIGDESIDPEFGTGAVGVTPAHSMVDYDMYERHGLDLIKVIGEDGKMTPEAGADYQGLTINEAREKFVTYLKANNLMEAEEEITHNVGKSDRFKDVVEVIPMEQWFVSVNKEIPGRNGKTLKDLMIEAVTTGHNGDASKKVSINPDRFNKIYFNWINNLRDWCISRQIWWGHRIPVWHCQDCGKLTCSVKNVSACSHCQSTNITQDEDTLDTWFSSGMWTFSILGWPEATDDFQTYHPNQWMQMGYEILFFWMARMILMTTYTIDDIPFYDVYIHGMLRDKDGKKFSKSAGTGIDPIIVSDEYGTDALRLSLVTGITPGNDSRFYDEKVLSARNFVNKLWNISRYILMTIDVDQAKIGPAQPQTLADQWIMAKWEHYKQQVVKGLDNYNFSIAAETLRDFTWHDLADWYVEIAKIEKDDTGTKDRILYTILTELLTVWHPYIPFVTEHIWQHLFPGEFLMIADWPQNREDVSLDDPAIQEFDQLINMISAIRQLRADNKIEPKIMIKLRLVTTELHDIINNNLELIKTLVRAEAVEITGERGEVENMASQVLPGVEIYLSLEGTIDKDKEIAKLTKEKDRLEKLVKGLDGKLSNEEFTSKAPAEIVDKEKEKLANYKDQIKKINERLNTL